MARCTCSIRDTSPAKAWPPSLLTASISDGVIAHLRSAGSGFTSAIAALAAAAGKEGPRGACRACVGKHLRAPHRRGRPPRTGHPRRPRGGDRPGDYLPQTLPVRFIGSGTLTAIFVLPRGHHSQPAHAQQRAPAPATCRPRCTSVGAAGCRSALHVVSVGRGAVADAEPVEEEGVDVGELGYPLVQ